MDSEGNPPRVDAFFEATQNVRKGDKAGSWVSRQAQETYVSNLNVYIHNVYMILIFNVIHL